MSKSITQKCKVQNCNQNGVLDSRRGKRYFLKGYCQMHYKRLLKYDSPEVFTYYRDGQTSNKLYKTYSRMKSRCYCVTDVSYKYYGKRGITVCDRWLGIYGFSNFIEDMGERPEGYSLDRIDNNKGYSPDNCRWATKHQQAANRRDNNEIVGVSYDITKKRYRSNLKVNNIIVLDKIHSTLSEAIEYRKNFELKYGINNQNETRKANKK